jgi:hypothetical protein
MLQVKLLHGLTQVILSIGDDGLTEYGWRMNKRSRGKGREARERKISEELTSHCRIYFPSRETVEQSKGGIDVSENPSLLVSYGQVNDILGWWHYLPPVQVVRRDCLPANSHAGLQKPARWPVDP